tara:strand:+ start:217 stop:513 length:297 start_codon:yes stop_codon:yes gene_type:complete
MIKLIDAVLKINPSAVVTITGSDIDTCVFDWQDGTTPISKTEIQTKVDELQAEYDAKEYQRKRKTEYPTIEECIHAILDDDLENLQAKRQAVKEKYPK